MLLEKRQYDDGTIIGLWRIEESLSSEKRKREKLAVRLLLGHLLGKSADILYNKDGAPSLADNSFHISISHGKDFAAVILHPTQRVGIDIEQINPRIEKLKHKFLSENELLQIDPDRQTEHLLVYWCAKETLFKLMPENEIHFAQQLHITPFPLQEEGTFLAYETRTEQKRRFSLHYEITPDYVMVWGKC
ncbi:MAG: 4'-phosphopantetheinyl transferase superfamily protein [Prevotellaceae bacterium]|jgi:phosphopantetheinyl transferase|nr:4'-phosphopantetheinyl transferase superfamily protein [Prevotellaceae bacterium]